MVLSGNPQWYSPLYGIPGTLGKAVRVRITQIIHGVYNPSAGPTYSVARLADELTRLGEAASVLTLGRPPADWPFTVPLRIHDTSTTLLGGVSGGLLREIRRLSQTSAILHGHGIWRSTNLFPLFANRKGPSRLVCSPEGTLSAWSMGYKSLVKQPFWRLLQKPALAGCHCLHATAAAEYDDIRRVGLRAPVTVIPNGVDIPEIDPDTPRSRQIVFLSRIDPVKGLDLLLPAWTAVAADYPDWELLIAGPLGDDYATRIRNVARQLATPRIRFLGQVLGPAKRSLLAGASLFVLPSYSENFGIAVAEALAHGLPVITTTATPWAEIRTRRCGWYISATEDALREALRAALSLSLPSLNTMGQTGRQWMEREYAWSQIADKMRHTYKWLLNDGDVPDWIIFD